LSFVTSCLAPASVSLAETPRQSWRSSTFNLHATLRILGEPVLEDHAECCQKKLEKSLVRSSIVNPPERTHVEACSKQSGLTPQWREYF
jgi:hypothetical protein